MSEDRNFVARWSRLKGEADREREAPGRAGMPPQQQVGPVEGSLPGRQAHPGEREKAFDISSLPPIDSITSGTDIRDFLQAGVPAELTKAALRRAWSADPAIRDFIGIAENQWDFTDPTAIPGFGLLQAGDNVRDLVAQAMGTLSDCSEESADTAAPVPVSEPSASTKGAAHADVKLEPRALAADHADAHRQVDASVGPTEDIEKADTAASQHHQCAAVLKRRRHGGALPKPA